MAEEIKQTESCCCCASKGFSSFLKVIFGLILLAVGVWLMWTWRYDLLILIKGCIGPFLVLVGIITLAIAKE